MQRIALCDERGVMDIKIADVFSENKFRLFRAYCFDSGFVYMKDLDGHNINLIREIDGIGEGKYISIVNRYKSYTQSNYDNMPINSQISMSSSYFNNSFKKFEIAEVKADNLNLEVRYFKKIILSNKQINELHDKGIRTIGDLYTYTEEDSYDGKHHGTYEKLYELVCQPTCLVIKSFYEFMSSQKNFKYFLKRVEGYTLQEIGDLMGVTRERVRQICRKYENILGYFGEHLLKVSSSNYEKHIVKAEEIVSVFDEKEIAIAIFHALKFRKQVQYIDFIDSYKYGDDQCLLDETLNDIKKEVIGDIVNYYEKLDDVENILNENKIYYIDSLDCIEYFVSIGYTLSGDFLVRRSASYTCPSVELVKKYFPEGIRVYNDKEQIKLRKFAKKEFPYLEYPESTRAVAARLADNLILCDRGKYIHKSKVKIEKALLGDIYRYIEEQSSPTLMYHEVFEQFKGRLGLQSTIDNRHYLHGVLREYYPDDFDYERDVMHKKSGVRLSIADRIAENVLSDGKPVKIQVIKSKFKGITDAIIFNSLMTHKCMIQWELGYIYHTDLCSLTEQEINYLKETIINIMSQNNGYCSSALLFEEVQSNQLNMLERNKVKTHLNLFYLSMNYLESEFNFRRPHITSNNFSSDDISMISLLEKNLLYEETISYDAVVEFGRKMGWSDVTLHSAFKKYCNQLFRLNYDKYKLERSVHFSTEIVESVRNYVIKRMRKGFLPLATLYDYDDLPEVEVEWNVFLMESIIEKYIGELKVVYPRITDRRYCRGVVVKNESKDFNYYTLAKQVVENSNNSVITNERVEYLMAMNSLYYDFELSDKICNELGSS